MIEDELVKIWQSSPNQERIKFEKSRLMIEVQSGIDRTNKEIKNRDLLETTAVVVIIPVFAYYAYKIPEVLTKIASVLTIFYGIYIVIRLQNAKKHKPGALSENYLGYLTKTRTYLTIQKHLLDTVLYWYFLPGYFVMTLFTVGTGKVDAIIKMQVLLILLCVVGVYLNKRAVKKTINPRLEKIDELISVFERDNIASTYTPSSSS